MLKKINFPLVALSVFGVRLVVHGAGIGEAIALAALAGLYGYHLFLESKKEEPINESIKAEIKQLRSVVDALKIAKTFR